MQYTRLAHKTQYPVHVVRRSILDLVNLAPCRRIHQEGANRGFHGGPKSAGVTTYRQGVAGELCAACSGQIIQLGCRRPVPSVDAQICPYYPFLSLQDFYTLMLGHLLAQYIPRKSLSNKMHSNGKRGNTVRGRTYKQTTVPMLVQQQQAGLRLYPDPSSSGRLVVWVKDGLATDEAICRRCEIQKERPGCSSLDGRIPWDRYVVEVIV